MCGLYFINFLGLTHIFKFLKKIYTKLYIILNSRTGIYIFDLKVTNLHFSNYQLFKQNFKNFRYKLHLINRERYNIHSYLQEIICNIHYCKKYTLFTDTGFCTVIDKNQSTSNSCCIYSILYSVTQQLNSSCLVHGERYRMEIIQIKPCIIFNFCT